LLSETNLKSMKKVLWKGIYLLNGGGKRRKSRITYIFSYPLYAFVFISFLPNLVR